MVQKTYYLCDQIVAPEARSIPARVESVELLPSIINLVGSNLILSRREVLQENRIVFAIQSRDRYAQN